MRRLKPSEIRVFPKTVSRGKALLLLYKDARVDMALLDEKYGKTGWKRTHREIKGNLFCTVSVYDKETGQWVEKEDVGVESYTEATKGEASDAFKRACFNWGIGRELYTAPTIWADLEKFEYDGKRVRAYFFVSDIDYTEDGDINRLVIVDGYGKVRYSWSEGEDLGMGEVSDKKQDDLADYRNELEVRILGSDLAQERKDNAIKGLDGYSKATLDNIDKMLKGRGY